MSEDLPEDPIGIEVDEPDTSAQTPKLPTPYRSVIDSIAASTTQKRGYDTKNNIDSPYRPHNIPSTSTNQSKKLCC